MAKFCIFDLETTGLDYKKCSIIQLAGFIIESDENNKFKILDKFNYKIRPRNEDIISKEALKINKFTEQQLMSFPKDSMVFPQFIELLDKHIDVYNKLDKAYLVGYNSLHFDQNFLKVWFEKNNNKFFFSYFWSNGIDIMSDAGKYFLHYRPAFSNFRLPNIAKALDITVNNNKLHDGLEDATLTLKIFLKLLNSPNILPWNENYAIELYNKLNNKTEKQNE